MPFARELLRAADVVHVVRIAAVDHDVAAFEQWHEVGDRLVHDGGRDHEPHGTGRVELLHQFRERGRTGGLLRDQIGHCCRRPVEHHAIVAVANQAPDHVGTHPAESDHSELHQPPLIFR